MRPRSMMRLQRPAVMMLAATLALLATGLDTSASAQSVPFKGTLTGTSDITLVPADPFPIPVFAETSMEGEATQLGRFSGTGGHSFSFSFDQNPVGLFIAGKAAFVAADGDQLFATYEAFYQNPFGTPPLPG